MSPSRAAPNFASRPVADFRFGSYPYARPLLRKLETSGHRNGLGGVRAILLGLLDLLALMQKRFGHSDLPSSTREFMSRAFMA